MPARQLVLVMILVGATLAAMLGATEGKPVAFPEGYRKWAHVKSVIVGPASPFFGRVGGWHHIYANELAVQGYNAGRFADGSVLVFDVLETREVNGNTTEGSRRFIDVMEKDSQRFSATGGWGYEEFAGGNRTLKPRAAQQCHSCHGAMKDHDSVFSRLRE